MLILYSTRAKSNKKASNAKQAKTRLVSESFSSKFGRFTVSNQTHCEIVEKKTWPQDK